MYSEVDKESERESELDWYRRELAFALERHEVCAERRADEERALKQTLDISRFLDARLTAEETVVAGPKGWLKRRVLPNAGSSAEIAAASELRDSNLFDGAWYLRTYPEVVTTGVSPALHYLRYGAAEGKDPGPDFSTKHYLARHPLAARRGTNPLLNHLRTHL